MAGDRIRSLDELATMIDGIEREEATAAVPFLHVSAGELHEIARRTRGAHKRGLAPLRGIETRCDRWSPTGTGALDVARGQAIEVVRPEGGWIEPVPELE